MTIRLRFHFSPVHMYFDSFLIDATFLFLITFKKKMHPLIQGWTINGSQVEHDGFPLLYGLQAKNIFYIFKVLQKKIKNMEHWPYVVNKS